MKSMPRGAEARSGSPPLTLHHLHKCHQRRKGQIKPRDNYENDADLADVLVVSGTPRSMSQTLRTAALSRLKLGKM